MSGEMFLDYNQGTSPKSLLSSECPMRKSIGEKNIGRILAVERRWRRGNGSDGKNSFHGILRLRGRTGRPVCGVRAGLPHALQFCLPASTASARVWALALFIFLQLERM